MTDAGRRRFETRSWLDPRIEVGASPIEGRGLFARAPIEAGEVVIVLGGRVLTDVEFTSLRLVKYSAATTGENLNILLDADSPVTSGNHSCDSNLWMQDEVTLVGRQP